MRHTNRAVCASNKVEMLILISRQSHIPHTCGLCICVWVGGLGGEVLNAARWLSFWAVEGSFEAGAAHGICSPCKRKKLSFCFVPGEKVWAWCIHAQRGSVQSIKGSAYGRVEWVSVLEPSLPCHSSRGGMCGVELNSVYSTVSPGC